MGDNKILNREKYLNALLFFVQNCNNDHLGLMKLNKLFYYLDFISYRDRQNSITGETYVHYQKGPLAKQLDTDILDEAQTSGLIERKEVASEKYGKRNRFKVLKEPNLDVFDEYEKKLLVNICSKFKNWKTDKMVAQTHSEAPWVFSDVNNNLSYEDSDDIEFFQKETVA